MVQDLMSQTQSQDVKARAELNEISARALNAIEPLPSFAELSRQPVVFYGVLKN